MIYFKISSIIEDSENTNLSSIISSAKLKLVVKIGYTDDNDETAKKRDSIYRTENPSIIHYKYILGGDKEDEQYIHKYLKDYLYAEREWFRLTPEVVEFIESVNTVEDIREKVKGIGYNIELKRNYTNKSKVLNLLIPSILKVLGINDRLKYFSEYCTLSNLLRSTISYSKDYESEVLDAVMNLYSSQQFSDILKDYEVNKSIPVDEDFISNYNNIGNFVDKMKYLCNYIKNGGNFDSIKYGIDDEVVNYYIVFGPDRIKSMSYKRDRLDSAVKLELGNQTLDPSRLIYEEFSEGNRYSKAFIKEKLKDIYLSINYSKTAKATDLEEYFEMKAVNYMDKGKKTHGFEIIKRKEN